MLSNILKDSINVPKTFSYRLNNNLITLADEEEACKDPGYAYKFARFIPGADIEKRCEAACKNPMCAYLFALDIPRQIEGSVVKRVKNLNGHIGLPRMFLVRILGSAKK